MKFTLGCRQIAHFATLDIEERKLVSSFIRTISKTNYKFRSKTKKKVQKLA